MLFPGALVYLGAALTVRKLSFFLGWCLFPFGPQMTSLLPLPQDSPSNTEWQCPRPLPPPFPLPAATKPPPGSCGLDWSPSFELVPASTGPLKSEGSSTWLSRCGVTSTPHPHFLSCTFLFLKTKLALGLLFTDLSLRQNKCKYQLFSNKRKEMQSLVAAGVLKF